MQFCLLSSFNMPQHYNRLYFAAVGGYVEQSCCTGYWYWYLICT